LIENEVVIAREIDSNGGVIKDIDGRDAVDDDRIGGISLSKLDFTAWALKGVPS